jgi:hypothetical protein
MTNPSGQLSVAIGLVRPARRAGRSADAVKNCPRLLG